MEATFDSENKLWVGAKVPYPLPMDIFIGEKVLESLQKTPERVLQIFHDEGNFGFI